MAATPTTTVGNKPTVIEALRRFMPAYLRTSPVLSVVQRRAIWAITYCRTPMLGGGVYACLDCDEKKFTYHSCNHKACPQCGRAATMKWVQREQSKRVSAPYFMVTFTLPQQLRELFFGKDAKAAYDVFFAASAAALSEKLADLKYLGAKVNGFSMVLHTWNQQLLFHPHIHCIVPGAGLDAQGEYVEVKKADYLVDIQVLGAALRHHFGQQMKARGWHCDPAVWQKDWGVNVQPFGNGENAIKYLGRYVSRSVIADSRIISISDTHVTYRYKDRGQGKAKQRVKGGEDRVQKLEGVEFVRRYLRHVLPAKLRGVRYYGYSHPAAKEKRQSVKQQSEARNGPAKTATAASPTAEAADEKKPGSHLCPCCEKPMRWMGTLPASWLMGLEASLGRQQRARGPPVMVEPKVAGRAQAKPQQTEPNTRHEQSKLDL